MRRLNTKIIVIVLLLMVFSSQINALTIWEQGDYTVPSIGWSGASLLKIYNDVSVTMTGEGGGMVGQFNMYNDSTLTKYGPYSTIGELNLYDNASAEIYGGDIFKLRIGCILTAKGDWIADPDSTAQVTLYARDVIFWPDTPPPEGYAGSLRGYWLANDQWFDISLYGSNTYSHITIVPEPASALIVSLGGLLLRLRRR